MKVVFWGVPLFLVGLLRCVTGATEGCALWVPTRNKEVCCEQCKPGNRLVSQCGQDPKKLCEPCKEGTYVSSPGVEGCHRCTQCTGLKKVKQACTSSSDTVCDCQAGHRCGDAACSFCFPECGVGQQPGGNMTCQPCPPRTFNDKIHSTCVPWSTKCPEPDQSIVKQGTAVHDITCDYVSDHGQGHTLRMMMAILGISMAFIIILILLSAYILIRWCKKNPNKKKQIITTEPVAKKPVAGPSFPSLLPLLPVSVSVEGRRLEEPESSCCFPQQEQGSSLESVASLDSKVKLLTV